MGGEYKQPSNQKERNSSPPVRLSNPFPKNGPTTLLCSRRPHASMVVRFSFFCVL